MNINYNTWFSERQLDFCPKHFVKCQAPLTTESKLWVYETLKGRFYISDLDLWLDSTVYFEDPQEATLYELTWS
jgi:hypothetical protein